MHKIRQFKEKTIDLIIYWSFLAQINWRGDQFDRSDPSTDLILIIMMETNPFDWFARFDCKADFFLIE